MVIASRVLYLEKIVLVFCFGFARVASGLTCAFSRVTNHQSLWYGSNTLAKSIIPYIGPQKGGAVKFLIVAPDFDLN